MTHGTTTLTRAGSDLALSLEPLLDGVSRQARAPGNLRSVQLVPKIHPANSAQHFHGDHLISPAQKRGREVKHPGQFSTEIHPPKWSIFG